MIFYITQQQSRSDQNKWKQYLCWKEKMRAAEWWVWHDYVNVLKSTVQMYVMLNLACHTNYSTGNPFFFHYLWQTQLSWIGFGNLWCRTGAVRCSPLQSLSPCYFLPASRTRCHRWCIHLREVGRHNKFNLNWNHKDKLIWILQWKPLILKVNKLSNLQKE